MASWWLRLRAQYPGLRGYTRPNLFRIRQFYEAYRSHEKVAPPVRQLPWTHHLIILDMLAAIGQRWTKRELERQICSGAVRRAAPRLASPRSKKVSPAVTQTHPTEEDAFKDVYSLEFLGLSDRHSEADLHGALLQHLHELYA